MTGSQWSYSSGSGSVWGARGSDKLGVDINRNSPDHLPCRRHPLSEQILNLRLHLIKLIAIEQSGEKRDSPVAVDDDVAGDARVFFRVKIEYDAAGIEQDRI